MFRSCRTSQCVTFGVYARTQWSNPTGKQIPDPMQMLVWLERSQESPASDLKPQHCADDTSTPDLQFLSSEERTLFSWLKLLLLFTYAGKNQDTWCEVKDWQCCCGSLEMNFPVLALLGSAFPPTLFWSCLSLPPPSSCVLSFSILSKIFSSESPCTGNITEYWAFSSLGCSSTFCL